jgi:hypothetical protein
MTRAVRGLLLGSIAIAYLFLLVHAREPLRLDIGDPASDASMLTTIHGGHVAGEIDNPPLSRLVYGAVSHVASGIGMLRMVALVFAGLASWLVFHYVSRLYDRRVGLIACCLFTTSLLWLANADSIHQVSLMHAMAFLALWGCVRALDTRQLPHYLALGVGSFACLLTAYDDYLVLPAAIVATVYLKAGSPFAPGNRRVIAIAAAACVLAIATTCALGHVPRVAGYNGDVVVAFPSIVRGVTLAFTPLVWIAIAFHLVTAIRSSTVASAIKDSAAWWLVVAVVTLLWFSLRAPSQLVGLQTLLPFAAIGSALIIVRLLDGSKSRRRLGIAWIAIAALWSLGWTAIQPRALLDGDQVSQTAQYLATNDANDFVLSNLLDDAPISVAFGRRSVPALDTRDVSAAPRMMLQMFEAAGTDTIHAIIFTDPSSRLVDRSLDALARPRQLWSVLGWPQIARSKSNALIREYDQRVVKNLTAIGARRALQLRQFSIYRIDRTATRAALAETVPAASHIDFDTIDGSRYELLGWSPLRESYDGLPGAVLRGIWRCRDKHCAVTKLEPWANWSQAQLVPVGQLMIRVDEVCDVSLTATFAAASEVRFTVGGFSSGPLTGTSVTTTIPAGNLVRGVNVVELESLRPPAAEARLRLLTIDLASSCAQPH